MIENLQNVAIPDGTQLGLLSACAICDLQGNLWGQSEGFPGIASDEAAKLMEIFQDPFKHCASGIFIGGTKVVLIVLFYISFVCFFDLSLLLASSFLKKLLLLLFMTDYSHIMTTFFFLFLNQLLSIYMLVCLFKWVRRRRRSRSREEGYGVWFGS